MSNTIPFYGWGIPMSLSFMEIHHSHIALWRNHEEYFLLAWVVTLLKDNMTQYLKLRVPVLKKLNLENVVSPPTFSRIVTTWLPSVFCQKNKLFADLEMNLPNIFIPLCRPYYFCHSQLWHFIEMPFHSLLTNQ